MIGNRALRGVCYSGEDERSRMYIGIGTVILILLIILLIAYV